MVQFPVERHHISIYSHDLCFTQNYLNVTLNLGIYHNGQILKIKARIFISTAVREYEQGHPFTRFWVSTVCIIMGTDWQCVCVETGESYICLHYLSACYYIQFTFNKRFCSNVLRIFPLDCSFIFLPSLLTIYEVN